VCLFSFPNWTICSNRKSPSSQKTDSSIPSWGNAPTILAMSWSSLLHTAPPLCYKTQKHPRDSVEWLPSNAASCSVMLYHILHHFSSIFFEGGGRRVWGRVGWQGTRMWMNPCQWMEGPEVRGHRNKGLQDTTGANITLSRLVFGWLQKMRNEKFKNLWTHMNW